MAATYDYLQLSSHKEHGAPAFCTSDNVLTLIAYINQEFELLGLPSLSVESPSEIGADVIFLINRFQDVFTLYHKTMKIKDDIQNRNHRLLCDLEHHQATQTRLKQKMENSEKEVHQEKEKCRQYNLKYKQVSTKLRNECEEVRRLKMVQQSRDVQHKHELNKKEKEINKLKERLHQLLADKVPDRKVGMDLMSLVSGSDGRRATWKTSHGKQEEETYQILINNYEVRHQELMEENGQLRDCLISLKRELSTLVKNSQDISGISVTELSDEMEFYGADDNKSIRSSGMAVSDLEQGHFQLPVDLMRKQVERSFKLMCEQVRQIMRTWREGRGNVVEKSAMKHSKPGEFPAKDSPTKRRSSIDRRNSGVDPSDVEKLKRQISNYKAIIQQQEDLIQQTLSAPSHVKDSSFLHESPLVREKENLSQQKKMFSEEKVNFDRERKIFTEAAIRLGRERKAFEEERAALLKQHFLNISPFKGGQAAKAKGDGQSNRLLPATPVYSPANSKHKAGSDLPTTPELFKALGLTSDLNDLTDSPRRLSTTPASVDMSFSILDQSPHRPTPHQTPSTPADAPKISPKTSAGTDSIVIKRPLPHSFHSQPSNSSMATPTLENIKASLMAKNGHG